MRPFVRVAGPLALMMAVAAGCTQNPFAARQQQLTAQGQQQQYAQVQQFQRRAGELDANNRDLHTQLARSQQQLRLLEDEVGLLRKRLGETANQLAESRAARQDADQRIQAMEASTRHRGGATVTANSNLRNRAGPLNIPGVVVRQGGGAVRIELPADKLFLRGTATLHQGAFPLLEQVAAAIGRQYPRQSIAIEAHTDNQPVHGGQGASSQQLSHAQASAIYQQLTARHRIAPARLSALGMGANQPIVSNGTPQGQARNRRIELVIVSP